MRYYILTYGCQMNKSDSERIAVSLEKQGYWPAMDEKQADLLVVSMCSVRESAVNKVYSRLLSLKPQKLKKPKIILTGCVLKTDKKKFEKLGVEVKEFKDLDKIVPKSSFVPIMRGCNNFCSYCVVPYTRGREKCRNKDEIICEIKHLIKKGAREITLLGQNVNSYKWKKVNFADLLKEVNALDGDFRIRFLTNHPKDMTDKLIDAIAECDKVVKYIHLPVQSGDNEILKKMNRKYTREHYLSLIKKIRNKIPDVELTTDIIVGFPGETEKQFQNTIDLIKRADFVKAYIARYSQRPATAAYKLIDNVTQDEKKRRFQILTQLMGKNLV